MEFKLIVAGGREFDDYGTLHNEIMSLAYGPYEANALSIVSGMARGADALAVRFARELGVVLYEFPAEWARDGKAAGFRRNSDMAAFSDGLLAFWDGDSRGTKHMIETMQKLNKPVHVVRY